MSPSAANMETISGQFGTAFKRIDLRRIEYPIVSVAKAHYVKFTWPVPTTVSWVIWSNFELNKAWIGILNISILKLGFGVAATLTGWSKYVVQCNVVMVGQYKHFGSILGD